MVKQTKDYDSNLESHIMSSNNNIIIDNGSVHVDDNDAVQDADSDIESHILDSNKNTDKHNGTLNVNDIVDVQDIYSNLESRILSSKKYIVKDNSTINMIDIDALQDDDSDLESNILNGHHKNLVKTNDTDQMKEYAKSDVKDYDSDLESQLAINNFNGLRKDDIDNDKSLIKDHDSDLENTNEKAVDNNVTQDDNHVIVKDEYCTLVKEETNEERESDTTPVVDSDVLFDPREYKDEVDDHSSLDDDEDVKVRSYVKDQLIINLLGHYRIDLVNGSKY